MDRLIPETSFEFVSFMNDCDIVVDKVYFFEHMYDSYVFKNTTKGETAVPRKVFSSWLNLWGFINYGRCYTHVTVKGRKAFKFNHKTEWKSY